MLANPRFFQIFRNLTKTKPVIGLKDIVPKFDIL
jgi:hypothetical protein